MSEDKIHNDERNLTNNLLLLLVNTFFGIYFVVLTHEQLIFYNRLYVKKTFQENSYFFKNLFFL